MGPQEGEYQIQAIAIDSAPLHQELAPLHEGVEEVVLGGSASLYNRRE